MQFEDTILLDKLKTEDNTSFELLYKFYFPSIASFVKKNSGTNEDAEDIFQEAVVVLLTKVRRKDFILTSSMNTYLYGIAKNIWFKRLRSHTYLTLDDHEISYDETEIFLAKLDDEKSKEVLIHGWLSKISKNCQWILKAIYFYEESMEGLIKKMGWKNKHSASNQKYKCIQQVKKEKDKEINYSF